MTRLDAKMIEKTVRLLADPDGIFEVRALDCHKERARPFVTAGYFDGKSVVAKLVEKLELEYKPDGVYVTLNLPKQACLARSPNSLTEYPKQTTTDNDIERIRWLLIDFDPVRPSGVSASDKEKEATLEKAEEVSDWLRKVHRWPSPVRADSGNGYHILFRVDLPNDVEPFVPT